MLSAPKRYYLVWVCFKTSPTLKIDWGTRKLGKQRRH